MLYEDLLVIDFLDKTLDVLEYTVIQVCVASKKEPPNYSSLLFWNLIHTINECLLTLSCTRLNKFLSRHDTRITRMSRLLKLQT